ncbi:conserved hypothetical protein [Methylocella tundrae]|uniref:Uncharacterized protein n=1 Tax=Methylocella tundrae TaxID=227605 RepID=A0A8B6M1P2_METTU|nr:hypothetical protein [Methylocella tundrae]VTZ48092.1 conserved hypothetical protein [Methylocella tundrae]
MLIFDFAPIGGEIRIGEEEPLRLRELIAGLRSGSLPATLILDRVEPDLSDEIRAVAAHRGVSAESFIVNALVNFALDAADQAWRRMSRRTAHSEADGEAEALSNLLSEALRRILVRDLRIGSEWPAEKSAATLGRRVGTA